MPLSLVEKKAMTDLLSQIDHDTFRLLLARDSAHLPGLAVFSSAVHPMPTVAFDFVYWLDLNSRALVPALTVMLAEFAATQAAPTLSLALDRLRAAQAPGRPLQPSWEVALIEGIPVINRLRLRALLKAIAENRGPSVVLVDGPAGTGRSHSYYLIEHVARSSGNKLIKIDIAYLRPEGRNLETIVSKLVSDLDLAGFSHPSSVGAPAETVGWRYADNLATALRKATPHRATWFVFDSLEKHPLVEVRAFVSTLIEMRLRMEVPGCVFFLLGAGPDYLPADELGRIESDPVGVFSPPEIEQYVGVLNQLGTTPLTPPVLVERASEITALLNQVPSDKVCRNIALKMVALRKEVNA
jgi:hypothetical protein